MPVLRTFNKIYYFSHIPKCGGSSIENYIEAISNKKLSFLDRKYYQNKIKPTINSSPQHILGSEVAQLFSPDFFDGFFTVVRNPYERFKSAFIFQKYFSKRIPPQLDINQFTNILLGANEDLFGKYDNHFVPQTFFLYPDVRYKVFKFENNFNDIKKYIDRIYNVDENFKQLPHILRQSKDLKNHVGPIDENSKRLIERAYKIDFINFKY